MLYLLRPVRLASLGLVFATLQAMALPSVSVSSGSVHEGDSGTTNMVFSVTLSAASESPVSVNYSTAALLALEGLDYLPASGTVNFSPGITQMDLVVQVAGDLLNEAEETFALVLSNPAGAELGVDTGVATILDNDPVPTLQTDTIVLVNEGDSGETLLQFTLTLSAASGQTVSVDYATADGTAVAGSDYVATNATLEFSPGTLSSPVVVRVLGDISNEENETFYLNLSNPSNASLIVTQAAGIILSDDPIPTVSIAPVSVPEGNSTANAVFTAVLSGPSKQTVSVNFSTQGITADPGVDYQSVSGLLEYPPGVTQLQIVVPVLGDLLDEYDEQFGILLSSPNGLLILNPSTTGTIIDDDPTPSLSIGNRALVEGNAGETNAVFDVLLSAPSGRSVTVDFATAGLSADSGVDFAPASGTLTFAPGQTSQSVQVRVFGDTIFETDETFAVNLSGGVNATVAASQGIGTILNDEPLPSLTVLNTSVTEGNSGFSFMTFTVSMAPPSAQSVSVTYATTDGTATAGVDYFGTSGTLNFTPGSTSRTVTIAVNGDTLNETDETFGLNLSNPVNAEISGGAATGTVLNDDPLPTVSVGDASVSEGTSGTKDLVFIVSLSAVSGRPVTVDYSTVDGTALAGSDYVVTNGTLTIAAGQANGSIRVRINGDTANEPDESFTVVLSNPANAVLNDASGTGTIQNDDALPSLSIGNVSVVEGDTGTVNAVFTVSLSAASGIAVTVTYATANGTATAGSDYNAASGSLTFNPGEVTKPVVVSVVGDGVDEPDETFTVTLSSPVNAVLGTGVGTGTILDNEGLPGISISSFTVQEGNSGLSSAAVTLSLSGPSERVVSVDYVTSDSTAQAGSDYVVASGTVSFAPGQTTQTLSVSVIGDVLNEADETFRVNLSNPVNGYLAMVSATGTILNDDPLPVVSAGSAEVVEGNSGTTNAVFTISLSVVSGRAVTVNFATAAFTASGGSDYVSTNGVLTFNPGELSKSIAVTVSGDALNEADETFGFSLTGPVNAALGSSGLGTILNDDPVPAISISSVTVTEGNGGAASRAFEVTLSTASGQTVTVDYASSNGTAVSPADYTATSGKLSFSPGETSRLVWVSVAGDFLDEPDETFFMTLSAPVNASLASNIGTATIIDDDALPSITISSASLLEGNAGTSNAVFLVSLSAASGREISVSYSTADSLAQAGTDYMQTNGILNFPAGVTMQSIIVPVYGDLLNEADEIFQVNIADPINATLANVLASALILNDDALPDISIEPVSVQEGNGAETDAVFTVRLSAPSGRPVTFNYATSANSAQAGVDYTTSSGTLALSPGQTSLSFVVKILGDQLYEADETFNVTLSGVAYANVLQSSTVATIRNDDPAPQLTITDLALLERDTDNTQAVFTVSFTQPTALPVSVRYATFAGTAAGGTDYFGTSGTLVFNPGLQSQTLSVTVAGDLLNEVDETFTVALTSPDNALIQKAAGTATIVDNDPLPSVGVTDAQQLEPDTGSTDLVFNLTLSAVSGRSVQVPFSTADVTATSGSDYQSTSGVAVFSPGSTTREIRVPVFGDTAFEANETFRLSLGTPTGAVLSRDHAIGTILENESRTLLLSNSAAIYINTYGAAAVYPSTISLSGLAGQISKVTVTLSGLQHEFPDHLDALLVAPDGQKVMLISDAGGGNAINNLNLTFDSAAANSLPDSSQLSSGTYKPTDFGGNDILSSPAPPGPYGSSLSSLTGMTPNGTWSLFLFDDSLGFPGRLVSGWRLAITTTNNICCSGGPEADLSVTLVDSPDPALHGNLLAYTTYVINNGPSAATGILVTNSLPAGADFVSASATLGTASHANGLVTCTIPTLQVGHLARLTVNVRPRDPGTLLATAGVSGNQPDSNGANNSASASTLVNLAPPIASISNLALKEQNTTSAKFDFPVVLSYPTNQTVSVGYTTASGSASAGTDYVSTYGTLYFFAGETSKFITVYGNGDTTIEPDESFQVLITNVANATLAQTSATGTILNDDGVTGEVARFTWDPVNPLQYMGVPFAATIRALDPAGNPATSFSGSAALSGRVGTGTGTSLRITEVDTTTRAVEFANLSNFSVDLAGWRITLYDWAFWPDPAAEFELPPGAVCPPGELFTLRSSGVSPGAYPTFVLSSPISWLNDGYSNQVAVLLRDPAGQIADFFCAVDGYPDKISWPRSIPSTEWSGDPVLPNLDSAKSYQRTGATDQNSSSLWTVAANNIGSRNPSLTVPWPGPQQVAVAPPSVGPFVNGVWSGSITPVGVGTNMYVQADDLQAHVGNSGLFTVIPTTDLAVSNFGPANLLSVGQTFSYRLSVTNHGPLAASAVTLTDSFPGPVSYIGASTTQGTISRSGNSITASLGNMPANTTATVTINLRADAPGTLTNTAAIQTSSIDYNASNNTFVLLTRVNFPPAISSIADQVTPEDIPSAAVAFVVDDVETPLNNLVIYGLSSNTNLLPSTNIVFSGTGASRSLTMIPLPNRFGSTTNTIVVSDGLASASRQFVLTVLPVNDPPVLGVVGDAAINEMTLFSLTNAAFDIDGNALSYELLAPPPGMAIDAAGRITWTPAEAQGPSTTVITTVVRDNGTPALLATNSFSLTVHEVNRPPTITLPATLTVPEGKTMNAQATATDPDLPVNGLAFSLVSGPAGLTVSSAGLVSWTPATGFWPGTNSVTLRVTDNGVPALSTTGVFTVIVNHMPVPATPVLDRFGATFSKIPVSSLLGTDPDGDVPVLYYLDDISIQGGSVLANDGWVLYEPPPGVPSLDLITYYVSDGRGGVAEGQVTVRSLPDESHAAPARVNPVAAGAKQVFFSGIPGLRYTIEVTEDPLVPQWRPLHTAVADAAGIVAFVDASPEASTRLYRLTVPNQE